MEAITQRAELASLESILGPFGLQVHQLQELAEKGAAVDREQCDRLMSAMEQDVLDKLKSIRPSGEHNLKEYWDVLVEEAESLLDTLDSLKPIAVGSLMAVEDPALPKKRKPSDNAQTIPHLNDCDEESPEDRRRIHEMELDDIDKLLKRYDKEADRLSRIDETDLPPQESYQCTRAIRELEDALRKFEKMK